MSEQHTITIRNQTEDALWCTLDPGTQIGTNAAYSLIVEIGGYIEVGLQPNDDGSYTQSYTLAFIGSGYANVAGAPMVVVSDVGIDTITWIAVEVTTAPDPAISGAGPDTITFANACTADTQCEINWGLAQVASTGTSSWLNDSNNQLLGPGQSLAVTVPTSGYAYLVGKVYGEGSLTDDYAWDAVMLNPILPGTKISLSVRTATVQPRTSTGVDEMKVQGIMTGAAGNGLNNSVVSAQFPRGQGTVISAGVALVRFYAGYGSDEDHKVAEICAYPSSGELASDGSSVSVSLVAQLQNYNEDGNAVAATSYTIICMAQLQ